MRIDTEFEAVKIQMVGPSPGKDTPYLMNAVDTATQITMRSMINEKTQALFQETFGVSRNFEQEYQALLDIRNANEGSYGSTTYDRGTIVQKRKESFFSRQSFEADRFNVTPFSSFVVFDGEGHPLGRVGIGQGYAPERVDIETLKKDAAAFSLTGEDIYRPGENETQLGVLLSPEDYKEKYAAMKHLGSKVAQFLISQGFEKPLNAGEKGYFDREKAPVDRWTFTIIDTTRLALDQVSGEFRTLLEFKQGQIEELEKAGAVRKYGYLLPETIDSRNYDKKIRIVYGQP